MYTDPRDYRYFKSQYESISSDDDTFNEFIDEDIRPVIRSLNTIPGVATAWSCSGHPMANGNYSRFYITMAVTKRGVNNIVRLHRHMLYSSKVGGWTFLPDLNIVHLLSVISDRFYTGLTLEHSKISIKDKARRTRMFDKIICSIDHLF